MNAPDTPITEEWLRSIGGWSKHTTKGMFGVQSTTHITSNQVGLQWQPAHDRVAITQSHLAGVTQEELTLLADILTRRKIN